MRLGLFLVISIHAIAPSEAELWVAKYRPTYYAQYRALGHRRVRRSRPHQDVKPGLCLDFARLSHVA